MALVTSYEQSTPGGLRIRVLCCYHGAKPDADEPTANHTVHFCQTPGGYLPRVEELWEEHGWGKRGKIIPICPGHRTDADVDWFPEKYSGAV